MCLTYNSPRHEIRARIAAVDNLNLIVALSFALIIVAGLAELILISRRRVGDLSAITGTMERDIDIGIKSDESTNTTYFLEGTFLVVG